MAALVVALIVFAHAGHWAVDALYLVPVLVATLFAQRHIISGLMSGATKG